MRNLRMIHNEMRISHKKINFDLMSHGRQALTGAGGDRAATIIHPSPITLHSTP